jgi:hypothetical protein
LNASRIAKVYNVNRATIGFGGSVIEEFGNFHNVLYPPLPARPLAISDKLRKRRLD